MLSKLQQSEMPTSFVKLEHISVQAAIIHLLLKCRECQPCSTVLSPFSQDLGYLVTLSAIASKVRIHKQLQSQKSLSILQLTTLFSFEFL